MGSLAFNAALFDTIEAEPPSSESNETKRRELYNKTIKKPPNKITHMKNQLVLHGIETEKSGLGDFNPPDKPISSGVERTLDRATDEEDVESNENDYMINKGLPSNLDNSNYNEQYIENTQYYGKPTESTNGGLINKLDYMIHLLEEQREIKTGSATEEVILYSFLGVFIIFVLDSFARAGKYTR